MLKNWGLKLFSLFLAGLLWFYAKTQMNYNVEIVANVQYVGLSQKLAFVDRPDSQVVVELTATGGEILGLVFAKPRVQVDLSRVRLGKNTVELGPDNLKIGGVRPVVRGFKPRTIEFFLDKVVEKKLSVLPLIKGQPAEGYVLSGVDVLGSPVVKGPQSKVSSLKNLNTQEINIQGKQSNFKVKVPVVSPDPGISVEPTEIEVQVLIEPIGSKTMTLPVVLIGKSGSFEPDSVKIKIEGPQSVVESFAGTVARIRTDTLGPGVYEISPEIRLPSDVKITDMTPKTIRIKMR